MSYTIPEIDLSLLKSNKDKLLNDLRHAAIEYGFFNIVNYDEYLDQNVITGLFGKSQEFFALSENEKNKIQILNSKHFLGYSYREKKDTTGNICFKEELDFCSTDSFETSTSAAHETFTGSNQYPSEEALPYFRPSVENFFYYLNKFSLLISESLLDSLGIDLEEIEHYINLDHKKNQFSEIKILNDLPRDASEHKGTLNSQNDLVNNNTLLTFLFQNSSSEKSLEVKDIYGNWLDATPKPNTIFITVGPTLEYLTDNVCVSRIYRIITPQNKPLISIPYFQYSILDARLKKFTLSKKLLDQKASRDELSHQVPQLKSKPAESIRDALFSYKIRSNRDVAEKWYPELLKRLDTGSDQKDSSHQSKLRQH